MKNNEKTENSIFENVNENDIAIAESINNFKTLTDLIFNYCLTNSRTIAKISVENVAKIVYNGKMPENFIKNEKSFMNNFRHNCIKIFGTKKNNGHQTEIELTADKKHFIFNGINVELYAKINANKTENSIEKNSVNA